ncbi:MAG TPA: hypothetical protein VF457_08160, partial [Burkholderiaceae bacterium]
DLGEAGGGGPAVIERLRPLAARIASDGRQLVVHRASLARIQAALRSLSALSADLLEATENFSAASLAGGAPIPTFTATSQVLLLDERLGRSADTVLGPRGVDPESVFLLGKDANSLREIVDGLVQGNPELHLAPPRSAAALAAAKSLADLSVRVHGSVSTLMAELQTLVAIHELGDRLAADGDALGHALAVTCAGTDAGGAVPWRMPASPREGH